MARSVVDFIPAVDPWPVIDAWAANKRFSLKAQGPWGRTYQRGDGFFTTRIVVQIEAMGQGLRLSAWIPFWGFGPESTIHDIDLLGYVPRTMARGKVNELLAALGAPQFR